LRKIIVQINGSFMALSQRKTTVAILRGVLGPIHGQEKRFAKLARRSVSWVKKVSADKVPLSERTARILEHETGVSLGWLLGSPKKPIVDGAGNPYDRRNFEWHRARIKAGDHPRKTAFALFKLVPLIASIGGAAGKKGELSLFHWRLMMFLQQTAEEFGTDDSTQKAILKVLTKSPLQELCIADDGIVSGELHRYRRDFAAIKDPHVGIAWKRIYHTVQPPKTRKKR
jgi:hypothetical protein